jgi:hypothetical protein
MSRDGGGVGDAPTVTETEMVGSALGRNIYKLYYYS